MSTPHVDAVVIGRNEGARLEACLDSLAGQVRRIVYVDSGSTDGSIAAAQSREAEVVLLDQTRPFTAARARNAGLARLGEDTTYVQFIDGDCALREGWIAQATAFLNQTPDAAVACGRRRERFPDASLYNRLCDTEWDTPVGQAKACGGDALIRRDALLDVGGYRDDLIAGEEPELCVRLRQAGWEIWRLDHEMTWHDAAMTRFSQWWRRTRRTGFAYAEGAVMHGAPPERHWVHETRRALIWGLALPVAALLGAILSPLGLLLLLAYPAQMLRLAARGGFSADAWRDGGLMILGKFAETAGIIEYWLARIQRRRSGLIEYK